ncbi:MAG: mannitol dehydrogenase family protein [Treponema sp.]|jgi:mannitol 2-dehydrogenase|nr:mannitol dehydrogenase family protein [Treponema sp.]
MKPIKLNQHNLSAISGVTLPSYDRRALKPSILHIGLGHFHRAHQAAYLDELLNRGLTDQGLFEMNIIPDSFPLGAILAGQDYLYTLMTKDPGGVEAVRVAGPILGYLNASGNPGAALDRIASKDTQIVSLTVTEKGYYFDHHREDLRWGEGPVARDVEHPEAPGTAAGYLAAGLAARYRTGRAPLTIMCCDNVPANGKLLKKCVLLLCKKSFPEIVNWIEDEVGFPCSMVDRITPGTTEALIRELENRYGVSDGWPVCGEDFRQWVLEDNFKTPVPDYGALGVQIVKNVEPYELMKMRLLNGSHSALAFPSYLLGYRRVDEGISDPLIREFIRRRYMEEITPTLEPVPGIDLEAYKDTLIRRFSNKSIGDTLLRLASDSSSKIPTFMLPPLRGTVNQGGKNDAVLFALAGWARFLSFIDEEGKPIPMEDPKGAFLKEEAAKAPAAPEAFLNAIGLEALEGGKRAALAERFKTHLERISRRGMRAALEQFLANPE